MAKDAIEEVTAAGARAFDKARAALPSDFPDGVASAIVAAAQRRLVSLVDNPAQAVEQ